MSAKFPGIVMVPDRHPSPVATTIPREFGRRESRLWLRVDLDTSSPVGALLVVSSTMKQTLALPFQTVKGGTSEGSRAYFESETTAVVVMEFYDWRVRSCHGLNPAV